MAPKLLSKTEENNNFYFTITDIDVSIVNGLRRTILSDIPIIGFKTTPHDENQCTIHTNTSRLNNEIIKHRLSCIPVHISDMSFPIDNYLLEVKKVNDSSEIQYVTTEDFNILDINTKKYLSKGDREKIFPINEITGDFIDFIRLRPKISNELHGEELDLSCKFSVLSAKINTVYNVTSMCYYTNTIDPITHNDAWEKIKDKFDPSNLEYEKKNWKLLDGNRYFKKNHFDFVLKTLGIYENIDIMKMACNIIIKQLNEISDNLDNNTLIKISDAITTIPNCFNIKLINQDYTIGKIIEYFLYENYYLGSKQLNYCGFIKEHPHDDYSIIRLGFINNSEEIIVKQIFKSSLEKAVNLFDIIKALF